MNKKLFDRDFTLLWLGKSVSQLGDGAGFIGLMWWVQSQTGSATALGLMLAVSTLIRVVLSPFSGALADRLSKKAIIVLMDSFRGLIYCLLAYLVLTKQLTLSQVIALNALNAACAVFFSPALSSSVPLIVDPENLPKANSFMQMTGIIVQIVSYTAGGVMVATIGVPLLLLIDGVSFIMSAFSEMFIHIPQVAASGPIRGRQFLKNVGEGFEYVRANKVLFDIMKVAAILNLVGAPMFILLPKFVDVHLGASATIYGYLLASMTLGTLVASLTIAFTKVVQNNIWLVVHGATGMGVLSALFAIIPRNWHYGHIFVYFLLGIVNGLVNIYFGSLIQRIVAKEHMGKVFGLMDTMSGGLQPISQAATGFFGDRVPVGMVFIATGLLSTMTGVKFSLIPNLREWLSPQQTTVKPSEPAAVSG